jgi:hypothetical protein
MRVSYSVPGSSGVISVLSESTGTEENARYASLNFSYWARVPYNFGRFHYRYSSGPQKGHEDLTFCQRLSVVPALSSFVTSVSRAPQIIMQTFEFAEPSLSSASYSTDGFLKGTPQIYGTYQEYLANNVRSPYNEDEEQLSQPRRFNPFRKFSRKWWGRAWDISVKAGKWPRIAYFSFGVILIIIWIVVMLTFAHEEVKYERSNQAGALGKTGLTRLPGEVRDVSLRMCSGPTIHSSL